VLKYRGTLQPAMRRSLQQEAGPAGAADYDGVTKVTRPAELQEAVSAGARHILITEHLDLTTLKIIPTSRLPKMLGVTNNTWTIRVGSTWSC
jgi:hypothetical protein